MQKSPDNPPAQYLWRPVDDILSSELRVRVGGSFVWPPPGVQPMVSSRADSNPFLSCLPCFSVPESLHATERPSTLISKQ